MCLREEQCELTTGAVTPAMTPPTCGIKDNPIASVQILTIIAAACSPALMYTHILFSGGGAMGTP